MMNPENTTSVIVSMPEPRLEGATGRFDKVAGDTASLAGKADGAGVAATDVWLDALADGLSQKAWIELDLSARLPVGLIEALRNEVEILDRTKAMEQAGIGRGTDLVKDRGVRRDRIAWMEGFTAPQAELFSFFEMIRLGLNQRLFLGLKRYEAHYATYQSGDFYRRHLDSFRGRASRMVSLVLYLNESWGLEDGGELRVFDAMDQDQVVGLVRPEAGRAVLFLSEDVAHEVLPAKRTRYSIACWFRQDEVPLPL
ncbi:2OG-Fe(II) oxygenase [Marinobacter daepoensis]|uniref:2OG-Fe(II) oxygenase n=1 Tax=Marinobacter daepoensis TaxID=262077 RepID=UPI001FD2CFD2|nr:2OG-Fe(II) oxygenase [Marinobacter daepoensis]